MDLQQVINEKQIAENAVKLEETDKDTKDSFGGTSPTVGAGRSSPILRKKYQQTDGFVSRQTLWRP